MFKSTKLREGLDEHVTATRDNFDRAWDSLRSLHTRERKNSASCDELNKKHDSLSDNVKNLAYRVGKLERELDEAYSRIAFMEGRLDAELDSETKVTPSWADLDVLPRWFQVKKSPEPTLAGKVNAIIDHLNVDLSVKTVEASSKVVASKKKTTKKKGTK